MQQAPKICYWNNKGRYRFIWKYKKFNLLKSITTYYLVDEMWNQGIYTYDA